MTFPTINWSARAVTEDSVDGGTSVTPIESTAGMAENDLLIMFWASDGNPTSVTVDAFWTEIRLIDHTDVSLGVWFGIRGASAPNYQISWGTNEDAEASVVFVDGGTFNATTPIDLTEDVAATGASTVLDHGPMDIAAADSTVIAFHVGDGTGLTTCSDGSAFTTPVCASWTEQFDQSFVAGGGQAQYGADSSETTSTVPAIRKTRADEQWITMMFAVEPNGVAAETRYIRSSLQSRKGLVFDADRLVSTKLVSADRST